jgi:phage-related protein
MPNFIWTPDQAAKRSVKIRVNRSQYGDGYSGRSADGINVVVETWDVSFSNRTQAEIDAIQDFLEAAQGRSSFAFSTPRGKTINCTCATWDASYNHALDASLNATFQQEYGG